MQKKSAQDTQIACANTKCTQKRGKTEHIGLYKYVSNIIKVHVKISSYR